MKPKKQKEQIVEIDLKENSRSLQKFKKLGDYKNSATDDVSDDDDIQENQESSIPLGSPEKKEVNFLSKFKPEKPKVKITKKYKKSEDLENESCKVYTFENQENPKSKLKPSSLDSPDEIEKIEQDLKEQLLRVEELKKDREKRVLEEKLKKEKEAKREKEMMTQERLLEKKSDVEALVDTFRVDDGESIVFMPKKSEIKKQQICPNCNCKLKKEKRFWLFTKKVKDIDGVLSQRFKCSNKSCGLVKEIRLNLR